MAGMAHDYYTDDCNKAPAISPTLASELLALPDAELRARLQAMVPETDEERALGIIGGEFPLWSINFRRRILAIHRKLQEEGL